VSQEEPAVVTLVSRARDGDQDAWEKIVRRHARLIWAICHEHGLDQDDTDYVAEAVWLALSRRISNLPEPVLPQWIARFTKQECMQVLSGAGPYARQAPNLRARVEAGATGLSVRSLTSLAAFLAGRKDGPVLRDEWSAHLAGESGYDPVTWAKVWVAIGFVIAALRDRGQDWADAAWRQADAVLRSRTRSNLFVLIPTSAAAYMILRHDGTIGLLTAFESIGTIGGLLYSAIRVGRWWRDVKPPEPKARRAKE
jgi:hypothetical protein